MTFYEEMQGVANELLTEFNQATVKLVVKGAATGPKYDPTHGLPDKYTFAGATVRGVSRKFIDGKDIVMSDLQVTASVLQSDETGIVSIRPTTSHVIEIDGKPFRIIADKSVPASGTVVAYIVVIRTF